MSLKSSLATQPAPWFVTALGTVVALVAAFGHLTPTSTAVLMSVVTAVGTVVVAFQTRPVAVSVISGAAATILGDFALFGLHLNSDQIGAVVGVVTWGLGAFLHLAHIQYISAREASAKAAR